MATHDNTAEPIDDNAGPTRSSRRPAYSQEQRRIVMEQYYLCVTRADKIALQKKLNLATLEQLYNLANRLGVTRGAEPQGGKRAFDPERLKTREDPAVVSFTPDDDRYLKSHFGTGSRMRRHLEEIAFHLGHTEAALMYHARHLGLRRFCKYWEDTKVIGWTGLTRSRLAALGVDFYDCIDRDGKHAITLVSTSSLVRMLTPAASDRTNADQMLARPRRELFDAGADRFFVAELDELAHALHSNELEWEYSRWVSHGHTCLNPWAGLSFRLFDDGSDVKIPGRGLHPSDLNPRLLSES